MKTIHSKINHDLKIQTTIFDTLTEITETHQGRFVHLKRFSDK